MTGLSLFSGIGGMDWAFEVAGGRVAAMCEKDAFCRKVLRKHWPDIPLFEDVRDLTGDMVKEVVGHGRTIDIIFGGFPCQPFSLAGNKKGRDDDRYLWPEFSRLVKELRPRWVVAENVPGIMRIAADDVCEDLERIGYEVGVWCYEAAAVGAPHRRMRVFFVAHAESQRPGSRIGERSRDREAAFETPDYQAPGSGEPSGPVPHSRRRMCKGGAVEGTFCGKPGERPIAHVERSDRSHVSDADSSRELQQSGSIEKLWERISDCSRRGAESSLGRVSDGLSPWLDGHLWWRDEPDIPRVTRGVPDRAQRLKALGNAVVPAQITPVFDAIMKADKEE